ncbi:MAG: hypothetical protein V3V08_07465 [Nannocystaceae bacterium]
MGLARYVLSVLVVFFFALAPGVAVANSYTFCFKYTNSTVDGQIGEDYYTTGNNWRARGAKIKIYRKTSSQSQLVYDGYASRSSGCRNVTTSATGGYEAFTIMMYPQARVHRLSSGNYVFVKAKSPTISENSPWIIQTQSLSSGTTATVKSASDALSRLMAVGDFAVYRWFKEATGFPPDGEFTVWMDNDNCNNERDREYACASPLGNKLWVPSIDNRTRRKFLISHEIGHLMYTKFYGKIVPWGMGVDPDENDACSFHGEGASRSHALQMKIPNSFALNEGFAHFFATDVFNKHTSKAYFDYYKDSYPGKVNVERGQGHRTERSMVSVT